MAFDEQAAALPARNWRDELIGTRELHVDVQLIFQSRDRLEEARRLRLGFQVDIDGRIAPTEKNCSRTAGEIDRAVASHTIAQRGHEPLQFGAICLSSHAQRYVQKTCVPITVVE